ncbi:MAG: dienelactone hydrolase family protein [Rhodocyclaceae bacterium]|nr:dienelactone hydrolase family protein [Rhodocyclaceae bacterium]
MRAVTRILVSIVCALCANSLLAQPIEPSAVRMMGVAGNMETTVYMPASVSPTKAALVLHTSSGLREGDHRFAQKLAEEGFVVAVPAFMKAYDITESTRQQTWTLFGKKIYADFLAIIAAVGQETKIGKDGFYAVGFSNGGHWSALLAARADVKAGVSYYGAFTEGGTDKNLRTFREAVNGKSHPLLILHGTSDAVVNNQFAMMLEGLYRKEGAPVAAHYFVGAGHSFERQLGVDANQAAASASWNLSVKFLQTN